jgi:hypothetical protein
VDIPELGDTENFMILMAGLEPYSHLATSFPPGIPIIRVQSNFASPEQDIGINRLIRERIEGHKGKFMLFIPSWQHETAQKALQAFGLAPEWRSCQKITDHLYDDKLMDLCLVKRMTGYE